MTFRVLATAAALHDAVEIGGWVASKGAPAEAVRWVEGLILAFRSLAEMPERCPVAPEDDEFEERIRHLILGDYRVLFTVRGMDVFILHVRHGARRPATIEELERALKELEQAKGR